MKLPCIRAFSLLWLLALPALAADSVYVVGLFKDRAVVVIDGKRQVIGVADGVVRGVRVISANSESAVLEVNGQRGTYTPQTRLHTRMSAPQQAEVSILRDSLGMFTTTGSINGNAVRFLVDTGATLVAMNTEDARRLGVDYKKSGKPSFVTTASGVEEAYEVVLGRVRVGAIELRNVEGVVLEGQHPSEVLLGMSFLGRLEMNNNGQLLQLRKKF